jgi:hypothetical protein
VLTALLFAASLLSLSALAAHAYGPAALDDLMLPLTAASALAAYSAGRRLSTALGLDEDVVNSMVVVMMLAMVARPTLPVAAHGLTAADLNTPATVFPRTVRPLVEAAVLVPLTVWLPHALGMLLRAPAPQPRRPEPRPQPAAPTAYEPRSPELHAGLELIDARTLALTPYSVDTG